MGPPGSMQTHVSAENARTWGTVGCFALAAALEFSSPVIRQNHLCYLTFACGSKLGARDFPGASTIVTLEDIQQARARLNGITVHTPAVDVTAEISDPGDPRRLFLKLENLQPIGAFKLR